MRPMIAGPTNVAVRVWTRPMTVGHIGAPLRQLLRLADLADRLRGLARKRELQAELRGERAVLEVLGAGAVADEAARLVLEAGDRVCVRHDGVRDQPHRAEPRIGPVERRHPAVRLEPDALL